MTLIIGGKNNGKYEYILDQGFLEDDIGETVNHKIIYKLNNIIHKCLRDEENLDLLVEKLISNEDILIIVCDEVGCGVVPVDSFNRKYREAVGRVCCLLAKKATVVERVYCGIATKIKG